MVPFIQTAREQHGVASATAYRTKQAAAIAKKAALGMRYAVHEDATPLVARINQGVWLVDCDCGAGNATDPAWGIACCFGCGSVHTVIVFPDDCEAIETALIGRRSPATRNWVAGESVGDLDAETAAHMADRGAVSIEAFADVTPAAESVDALATAPTDATMPGLTGPACRRGFEGGKAAE